MRFEMAKALTARARERAAWIGDDHGDPYEAALLNRTVPLEMHIALKEILDHLRSGLDYCAHEMCEVATGRISTAQIYFPITARGFAAVDFPSRVGKLMPGLVKSRPDLVTTLAGFQPFTSKENGWLADLATLANRTKHVELNVNSVDAADVKFTRDPVSGILRREVRRSDGMPVNVSSLALIDAPNGIEGQDCRLIYLRLGQIEQELLGFLSSALIGVSRIIETVERSL